MHSVINKIIREELGRVFTDIHGKKSSNVEYTGVIIEGDDIVYFESELNKRIADIGIDIPQDWKSPDNYHMTITLGELSLSMKMAGAIGTEVGLEVYALGISDVAVAVAVKGLFSKNEMQHITLSFKNKPADSNEISKWIEFEPFMVKGYVREVTNGNFSI